MWATGVAGRWVLRGLYRSNTLVSGLETSRPLFISRCVPVVRACAQHHRKHRKPSAARGRSVTPDRPSLFQSARTAAAPPPQRYRAPASRRMAVARPPRATPGHHTGAGLNGAAGGTLPDASDARATFSLVWTSSQPPQRRPIDLGNSGTRVAATGPGAYRGSRRCRASTSRARSRRRGRARPRGPRGPPPRGRAAPRRSASA